MINGSSQLLLVGVFLNPAIALQEADDVASIVAETVGSRVEFRLTPGLYLPRLVGNTKLGPSPAAHMLDFRSDIDLNAKKQIPNVELSIIKDDYWQLQFNAFKFSTRRDARFSGTSDYGALSFTSGDAYRAEFSMSSFSIELSPRIWRPIEWEKTAELFFSPTFGVRMYEIDQMIEQPGVGREDVHEEYFNAYVGMQLDLRWDARETISWLERLEVNAGVFGGPALGADKGIGWSVRASLNLFLTEDMSFLFGYRLYELNIEDGEYELNGGLQGLFLGGTVRF